MIDNYINTIEKEPLSASKEDRLISSDAKNKFESYYEQTPIHLRTSRFTSFQSPDMCESELGQCDSMQNKIAEENKQIYKKLSSHLDTECRDANMSIFKYKQSLEQILYQLQSQEIAVVQRIREGVNDESIEMYKEKFQKVVQQFQQEQKPNVQINIQIMTKSMVNEMQSKIEQLNYQNQKLKRLIEASQQSTQSVNSTFHPEDLEEPEIMRNSSSFNTELRIENFLILKIQKIKDRIREYCPSKIELESWKQFKVRKQTLSPTKENLSNNPIIYELDELEFNIDNTLKFLSSQTVQTPKSIEQTAMKSSKSILERDDLDQLRKEIIKNERLKLSTEIAQIHMANRSLTESNFKQQQQLSSYITEINNLYTRINELDQEKRECINRIIDQKEQEFSKKLIEMQEDLQESIAQASQKLKSELDFYKTKLSDVQEQKANLEKKVGKLKRKLLSNKDSEEKINQLTCDIHFYQQKIELLNQEKSIALNKYHQYKGSKENKPAVDKQIQIIRQIYSDQYDELFKLTHKQISQLEDQLEFMKQQQEKSNIKAQKLKQYKQYLVKLKKDHEEQLEELSSHFNNQIYIQQQQILEASSLVVRLIQQQQGKKGPLVGALQKLMQVSQQMGEQGPQPERNIPQMTIFSDDLDEIYSKEIE